MASIAGSASLKGGLVLFAAGSTQRPVPPIITFTASSVLIASS